MYMQFISPKAGTPHMQRQAKHVQGEHALIEANHVHIKASVDCHQYNYSRYLA